MSRIDNATLNLTFGRYSSDNEFNSTFGMIDPESLDQRESMRIANQDRVRNERLSIQKNFQDQMIEKSKNRAQTVSDIYNNIDLENHYCSK